MFGFGAFVRSGLIAANGPWCFFHFLTLRSRLYPGGVYVYFGRVPDGVYWGIATTGGVRGVGVFKGVLRTDVGHFARGLVAGDPEVGEGGFVADALRCLDGVVDYYLFSYEWTGCYGHLNPFCVVGSSVLAEVLGLVDRGVASLAFSLRFPLLGQWIGLAVTVGMVGGPICFTSCRIYPTFSSTADNARDSVTSSVISLAGF